VADVPESYATLDVCVNAKYDGKYTNCSRCWKCLRTLATLEIAGRLDCYQGVFDIDAYESQKDSYFLELMESDNPYAREIIQFAKDMSFSFPSTSRFSRHPVTRYMAGLLGCSRRYIKNITK
jgi:hypothetical protein